ncbi:MAG TPA: Asp23/Gls24 family envelope stress response protein [Micromonosporaceae bacterium]|nr:Asp23/Gls24 family envelope stress response protein [Micromonosporaceae bacterium]
MTDAVKSPEPTPAAGSEPETAPRGTISISEEVIEKIAVTAVRQVPGVADLGGDVARFFNTMLDRVGLNEVGDARRGVSAEVTGNSVVINVVIVLEAGYVVPEVTETVRAKVIEAVEQYGLQVTQVNIKVDDIELSGQ